MGHSVGGAPTSGVSGADLAPSRHWPTASRSPMEEAMCRHPQSLALVALVLAGAGCSSGTYYYDPYVYDSTYDYWYDSAYYYSYYDPFYGYYYSLGGGAKLPDATSPDVLAGRVAMA